jgi:hypothetical protein
VINVVDATNEKMDLTEKSLDFTATSNGKQYAFNLDFLKEINVEESKKSMNARSIIMVLVKKESGYWTKLTESKKNFLKTGTLCILNIDFSRWKDEDEEDEEETGMGMPGMGMPGMGMPGMEGMDFSSFGGMGGGMPGMGGMDMNAMMESLKGGENADSDDEEEEKEKE